MFSSNGSQVSGPVTYVEDVFNTFTWTGTGGQAGPFVTGVDLLTEGGLLWTKQRMTGYAYDHYLFDTIRGNGSFLVSNSTAAAVSSPACINFYSNGFKDNFSYGGGIDVVSWSFRKQPKFFDVVTYTGTGSNTTIAHSLGSVPGCIIVKKTNSSGQWCVYHRGLTSAAYGIFLNLTDPQTSDPAIWNSTAPTSSVFSLGNSTGVNNSGDTYVAYLFAHDAGGFGLTGADNVISCGSFTKTASYPDSTPITLGWEPQFVLFKRTDSGAENWNIGDVIRGSSHTTGVGLSPNLTNAETATLQYAPLATGFNIGNSTSIGGTYIYIAIRRGPMKVPTVGTSVFAPILQSNVNTPPRTISGAGFAPDLLWQGAYQYANGSYMYDRVRGQVTLQPTYTDAEVSAASVGASFTMDGITYTSTGSVNNNGNSVDWFFKRAPGFFDEVCYRGTGTSSATQTHNLGVVPELIILKSRTTAYIWYVFSAAATGNQCLILNSNSAWANYGNPARTSTTFTVTSGTESNYSADNYVAYLFATCPGVSKVGSYTGTGTTLQIDCGFTAGARFVLIKRTDSTGDWYVWDTARGIIAGNDPYLLINSAAVGVTSTDYIDTYNAGFELSSTAPAAINASAGTFIFLAIA